MATAETPTPNASPASTSCPVPKDDLMAALEAQPADSTYEELLRELHMRYAIRRGIADIEAGRVHSNEEVQEMISSWSK